MVKALVFYLKLGWFLLSRRIVPESLIKKDYDLLAPAYDKHFSCYVKVYSKELVEKLDIRNGAVALDLACGTGTITSEISRFIGPEGKIVAVDMSEAMLEKAKEKVGLQANVEFICGEMKETLKALPDNYFDYITSGWAIAYSEPLILLKMIRRILKPGGKLGIIENRSNTLSPIRETGIKVAQRYPEYMRYIMDLPFRLPADGAHLNRMFINSGLKTVDIWQGDIEFSFNNGKEVLEWVLHTGVSAGFDRVMDPLVRKECDEAFIEFMERDYGRAGKIKIYHRFVAGIAGKT